MTAGVGIFGAFSGFVDRQMEDAASLGPVARDEDRRIAEVVAGLRARMPR